MRIQKNEISVTRMMTSNNIYYVIRLEYCYTGLNAVPDVLFSSQTGRN
jgi:hypothetical protein